MRSTASRNTKRSPLRSSPGSGSATKCPEFAVR
jgi:hypothetical protein